MTEITTVDQLQALPDEAIVLSADNEVWRAHGAPGEPTRWGVPGFGLTSELMHVHLPATVLHPTAQLSTDEREASQNYTADTDGKLLKPGVTYVTTPRGLERKDEQTKRDVELEMVCASAATRFDSVLDGTLPNPDRLSRGEWIARAVSAAGFHRTPGPPESASVTLKVYAHPKSAARVQDTRNIITVSGDPSSSPVDVERMANGIPIDLYDELDAALSELDASVTLTHAGRAIILDALAPNLRALIGGGL